MRLIDARLDDPGDIAGDIDREGQQPGDEGVHRMADDRHEAVEQHELDDQRHRADHLDVGAQQVVEQEDVSREVAERLIQKSDDNRSGFFRFAFNREWNDLSLFDLVISTEKMSLPSVANVIVETAQKQEMKTCSLTALDAMDRLSLEKKIEAALLKNSFNPLYIHVTVPDKGVALVRGLSDSDDERDRLQAIVRAVDGVREVRGEVSVRPASLI